MSALTFTCPQCGRVSHNPHDASNRYCGACHLFFDDIAEEERENPTLGPCCGCGKPSNLNVVMLSVRCMVPGHGWGCVVCNLPADGATAVLCDACTQRMQRGEDVIRFACRGYPGSDGRAPIADFIEPFDHDAQRHAEADA